MLFALRLAIGALEAPSYPINNRVVTTWFPENERATAIGVYTSGQFVGLALLTPALVYLQVHFGWRSIFISVGLAGVIWAAVWRLVYRGPLSCRAANAAEIDLIRNGGGLVELSDRNPNDSEWVFRLRDLGYVLSKSKLWGIYIGQYALNSTLWFFLTWFPTYLVHLNVGKVQKSATGQSVGGSAVPRGDCRTEERKPARGVPHLGWTFSFL
jgi:ACS family D-galactonate transporter-like MFS transporter